MFFPQIRRFIDLVAVQNSNANTIMLFTVDEKFINLTGSVSVDIQRDNIFRQLFVLYRLKSPLNCRNATLDIGRSNNMLCRISRCLIGCYVHVVTCFLTKHLCVLTSWECSVTMYLSLYTTSQSRNLYLQHFIKMEIYRNFLSKTFKTPLNQTPLCLLCLRNWKVLNNQTFLHSMP